MRLPSLENLHDQFSSRLFHIRNFITKVKRYNSHQEEHLCALLGPEMSHMVLSKGHLNALPAV